MATSISLNNVALPLPSQYVDAVGYRVAQHVGLDSMVSVDTRAGAALTYRDVSITWEDVTPDEMQAIRGAWQALIDAGEAPYVDPLGIARTAQIMPGGKGFDSLAYVGRRSGSNVFEALFRVGFQMRVTP